MAKKTLEEYKAEFKKHFPPNPSAKWDYAKAIVHVLQPYIIDHADTVFESAQYAQVKENEKGVQKADAPKAIKDAVSKSPLIANSENTIWAAEAVMIKALIDLGSDLPVPASNYPATEQKPTFLNCAVWRQFQAGQKQTPGHPVWEHGPDNKWYVRGYETQYAYRTQTVFARMRTIQAWFNTLQAAINDEGRTIADTGGTGGTGWWHDALKSKKTKENEKALADAGVNDEDALDETITDAEEVKAERKFQEQCFLIDYWQEICSVNACEPYGKYFTCVGPSRHSTVNPSSVISRIVAKQDVHKLMSAPQELFARIQPKVRLFKRYRVKQKPVFAGQRRVQASGKDQTLFENVYYQPEDKIVQKEIKFADNDHRESVEAAFAPTPGGFKDGVALQRFDFTYYGANPIEADRNITCKMSLFFRNLEDLGASDSTGGGRTATFLDLILFGPNKAKAPNPNPYGIKLNEWNPDYYEIKAAIGYFEPPGNDAAQLITDQEGRDLKNFLKNSTVNLGLVLLGHTFNFNEDGSGTLEIEFQGIVESHLSSNRADLFYTSKRLATEVKRIDAELAYIEARIEQGADEGEANVEISNEVRSTETDMIAEWFDLIGFLLPGEGVRSQPEYEATFIKGNGGTYADRKKILEEKRSRFVRNEKTQRYGALINRLLAMDKMRYIDVNHAMMGGISEGREQLSRMTSSKRQGAGSTRKPLGVKIRKANSADLKKRHEKYLDGAAGALDDANDEETKKKKQKEAKDSFSQPAKDKDKYRVNFFYLGDLMEAAFYQALDNPKEREGDAQVGPEDYTFSNIHFLMGPITFVDPRTHSPVEVNLADIPVSLNLFMTWYLENVISPQRDTYYIRNFIRDVLKSLILETLSPGCFYKYPIRPRFNMVSISGPGIGKKGNTQDRVGIKTSGKGGKKRTGARIKGRILDINHIAPYPDSNIGAMPPREFFYDFIYCHDGLPYSLKGDPIEDSQNGIYHFQVGSDKGILKNVTFDRQDQPYVREARTVQDGADPIAAQLRHQYNVTMKCFGSTVFKPGMRVHVTPRLATQAGGVVANLETSLTYKLGLGGYIFLTKVENVIEPGRFETILYGINDGMVKRIGKTDREEPIIVECMPQTIEEAPAEKENTAKQTRSLPGLQTPSEQKADQTGTPLSTVQTSKVPAEELDDEDASGGMSGGY